METAGPGGNALGRGAHLKTKRATTSAGSKTAGKTVALARRFARFGTLVSIVTSGAHGAGKLKIAIRV